MMHKTPLLSVRHALNALMIAGMAALSLQSQAQFQAVAPAVSAPSFGAAEVNAMGGGAAAPAAGLPAGMGNAGNIGNTVNTGIQSLGGRPAIQPTWALHWHWAQLNSSALCKRPLGEPYRCTATTCLTVAASPA
jgi:membrane protease subunit (stomatin/prohibitin family)